VAHNVAQVQISAPREEVFDWILEPRRLARWVEGLVEHEQLAPHRFRQVLRILPPPAPRLEALVEVRLMHVPRRLQVVMTARRGFVSEVLYVLDELPGPATRLTMTVDSRLAGTVSRVLAPLVGRQAQRRLEGDLQRLKRLVEQEAPAPA
jgi:hypothetical protein